MNKEENGALSFEFIVSTSDLDRADRKLASFGDSVEEKAKRIGYLMSSIPSVNIDVVANVQALDQLDSAFADIDRVRILNEQGIKELEAEYERLGSVATEAFNKGTAEGQKEADAIQVQQGAIRRVINARKQAISEANKQCDSLIELEKKMNESASATNQNADAQSSLRTRLREMKMELVEMEAAGQRGTQAYRDLQEETAKLTDAWGDAQAQATILANDQRGFAGVVSGLTGLTGGFQAASSAISLFTGENEDLQRAMLKVQQLMSITMGLQAVQQTLNKDSAFSLVTLNGLKEWWAKITAEAAAEETAETAAKVTNTVATVSNTSAQVANATAAKAGTAANLTLAGAFRAVGLAIKSIPGIGWLVAAIAALGSAIAFFVKRNKEADDSIRKQQANLKEGREAYIKAAASVSDLSKRISTFNGTKEQEKALIDEANGSLGKEMGYCKSLAEWKQKLSQKSKAYCEALMQEAMATAYLNKYVEANIKWQEAVEVAKNRPGLFGGNVKEANKLGQEAQELLKQYNKWSDASRKTRQDAGLGGYSDDTKETGKVETDKFDAKKASRIQKKALDEYTEAVRGFIKDSSNQIQKAYSESADEGLAKDLADIKDSTERKKEEWRKQLSDLAKVRQDAVKQIYLSKEGNTEDTWETTAESKKTTSDYEQELLFDENGNQTEVAKQFYAVMDNITDQGEQRLQKTRQKYYNQWVEDYGTTEQKIEKLISDYTTIANNVSPEFQDAVFKEMDEKISSLVSSDFKKSIDWSAIFGDMGEQSLQSLQYNLDKIKEQFEKTKDSMSTEEIKDYQEAIAKLEDEISSRNPFLALHQSIKDIGKAKDEFTSAMQEWTDAQAELTNAQNEYDTALELEQELRSGFSSEEEAANDETYANAKERVASAQERLNKASDKNAKAEQKALKTQSKLSNSYKKFANTLGTVGGAVTDIAGKAKNLASLFSDDVADSMGVVIDFTGEVMDAVQGVMSTIGEVTHSVSKGVEETVDATSGAVKATATAGAQSLSTIEKASVILAVISAAMQVAMAIAGLFNKDKTYQKEIDALQARIDQLQWELDNADTVRLQENVGKAMDKLKGIYADTYKEVLRLHGITTTAGLFLYQQYGKNIYQGEIMKKSIEKLADAYTQVSYSADKALGADRYKSARKQIENLAQQQMLIRQQIELEEKKKKTDKDKLADYQKQIEELGQKMADVINEMMEDIIGSTSEDLAKQLGDAFIDAFSQGEDAAQAWGDKVNDIVSDILKKMLVQEFLEKPMAELFNKYKEKWFPGGNFQGLDVINSSMGAFADDLNGLIGDFQKGMEGLPQEIRDIFTSNAERSATQKGIASASQDSVDELNGRMTAVQSHTFSIMENTKLLVSNTSAILRSVMGIEEDTGDMRGRMASVEGKIESVRQTLSDINTKGVKLR